MQRMPDDGRKPLVGLPKGIPTEWRDFVRCRRDSLDLEPGDLDWLPNFPSLELSFKEGLNGSTILKLTGLGGVINIDIGLSVQDGRLVVDTSDIPIPAGSADSWVNDFNADLKANGMQFSGVSIRDGKLHLAKKKIAPASEMAPSVAIVDQPTLSPPPPPAHVTDPIPEAISMESEQSEGDEEPDASIPHPEQAALSAPHSLGADIGATRSWARWSRVGAPTAGAFVLSVAAFFLFVADREDPAPPPTGQENGSVVTAATGPETSTSSSTRRASTSSEPVAYEPVSMGSDETGDQENSNTSQTVAPGQEIPGGDITEVSHRMETNGSHSITFHLAGDGRQFTEPGTAWYDVILSAESSAGDLWQANGAWFSGQYSDRGIRLGPVVSGREALPDGIVTITFLGSDVFDMNIDGGGELLELAIFTATIGVSVDGETRWHSVVGEAGSS
jgi:hypothetical protein